MKKETSSTDSWVDPAFPEGELAVQFNRETQSLQLVRKGATTRSRGCTVVFFIAMFVVLAYGVLSSHSRYPISNIGSILATFFLIAWTIYDQQVEIDTRSKTVVARLRGMIVPWSWNTSIPIAPTARFEVSTQQPPAKTASHTLYFVPYPDAWFTFWRPTPIATAYGSEAGTAALERLAFGLNRFLEAVRKGEPNLERLAQPAPPGPFKP
jgi:hypothetical protein